MPAVARRRKFEWVRFVPAASRTGNDGAGTRTRTADLRFTKPLLYRLSYAGNGTILTGVALV